MALKAAVAWSKKKEILCQKFNLKSYPNQTILRNPIYEYGKLFDEGAYYRILVKMFKDVLCEAN